MGPTDDLLRRLDDSLGEAALDPSRWAPVLAQVSDLVGGDGAMLLQSHRRTPGIPCTPEVDELVAAYFRHGWHQTDIRTRAVPRVMRGEVVTDADILTAQEMARSPFYNELLLPHGYHWFAVAGFHAGAEHWAVSVQRKARHGPFEAAKVRPLAGLAQRLGRAATLSEALGRAALDGALSGLDQVAEAALALDGTGRVLGANRRAESLFDAAFRIGDGALRIADPRARDEVAALTEALRLRAPPAGPVLVPRRDRRPLILRLLPLAEAVRSPFLGASGLLLVTDLEAERRPDPALLAQVFGLTAAEARLAAILAGGASLEEAAEALGSAVETVRSQIKAVFAKTGTGRQGALVALLGAPGLR
ncbi:helix-turn-helix transcriptional regulator [Methylobacterium nonmethylotrophicum]|uniref:Helix-turn-helix transcriptional regulator n=1 Tax=Methylobacterium nonmethylotrophicum TaxID=1141884 RepID=A0A4Z0NLI7_9HYPH|nr:helix-turn-helix transcriptional regulator [Methylobacterium nonmethylotrophicum]TGD97134.1 helix-turn-helix transcriptional regulator [Methylobacterium nonmethylotrophicum]